LYILAAMTWIECLVIRRGIDLILQFCYILHIDQGELSQFTRDVLHGGQIYRDVGCKMCVMVEFYVEMDWWPMRCQTQMQYVVM
jgi:hypothetical protein